MTKLVPENRESHCVKSAIQAFIEFFELNLDKFNNSINKIIDNSDFSKNVAPTRCLSVGDTYKDALNDYSNLIKSLLKIIEGDIKDKYGSSEEISNFLLKFTELTTKVEKSIKTHYKKEDNFDFKDIANMMYDFMSEEFPELSDLNEFKIPITCEPFTRDLVDNVIS